MQTINFLIHFFEDEKLKAVRAQKDGDTVTLLYTMLITVAVKSNANGKLMLCSGIPYDEKILSGILGLNEPIVKDGFELLVSYGLLTVVDGVFSLVGYDEYADTKSVRERKQSADRQARFMGKQTEDAVIATDKNPAKPSVAGGEQGTDTRFKPCGCAVRHFCITPSCNQKIPADTESPTRF